MIRCSTAPVLTQSLGFGLRGASALACWTRTARTSLVTITRVLSPAARVLLILSDIVAVALFDSGEPNAKLHAMSPPCSSTERTRVARIVPTAESDAEITKCSAVSNWVAVRTISRGERRTETRVGPSSDGRGRTAKHATAVTTSPHHRQADRVATPFIPQAASRHNPALPFLALRL